MIPLEIWWDRAQSFITDWAANEYKLQVVYAKKHKSKAKFRYMVPEFQQEFIKAMGQGDEEKIKTMMMFSDQFIGNDQKTKYPIK